MLTQAWQLQNTLNHSAAYLSQNSVKIPHTANTVLTSQVIQIQNGAPLTHHLLTPRIRSKQMPGTEFSGNFARGKRIISSESDIQPSAHHGKTQT